MSWKVKKLSPTQKEQRRRDQNRTAQKTHRALEGGQRSQDIAVLDFETDPFDNESKAKVFPFLATLVSHQFEPVVIWDDDPVSFIERVIAAIEALPRAFTIYAHNGGKFDYMFFVHKLRGEVMFKGRGLMSCRVGPHELRDSFHIIPEKLASYRKDDFDYTMLFEHRRETHRATIIKYCLHDSVYLLDIVCAFVAKFGRKLSIGQAAQSKVREAGYAVGKFSDHFDAYIRKFYFGGRVECLAGIGHFISDESRPYRLYDVNSMYPDAMVRYAHPIGSPQDYIVRPGKPGAHTVFLELICDNDGALVSRTEDGGTSAMVTHGKFFTTIHEYNAALELGLIRNVKVTACIDCAKRTTFEKFIVPAYNNRLSTKAELDRLKKAGEDNTPEFFNVKKDDIFWKLLQNNSYGKFAQNPRRFNECYITDIGECPPDAPDNPWGKADAKTGGRLPNTENFDLGYAIWERPQKRLAFNNVGTAASITGAARATLLRGIAAAVDPIYCDTDSIICRDLPGMVIHKTELGAWDIEDTFSDVIIAGKKLYACKTYKGEFKIRMKGSAGAEWEDFRDFLAGKTKTFTQRGPTMTRTGGYHYMSRRVRATGPKVGNLPLLNRRKV